MVRVAAFQGTPKSTFDARILQIIEILEQADREQIDFLCFPEGFLTGYYAERELAEQTSIEVANSCFQNFLSQTIPFNTTFIIGFNEREGDKIFDSAAVIEKGKLLGTQRKHYLYDGKTTCPGHSAIYDPDGREIVRSREGEQHFIVADITEDRLFHEKGRRMHGSAILAEKIAKLNQGIIAWK